MFSFSWSGALKPHGHHRFSWGLSGTHAIVRCVSTLTYVSLFCLCFLLSWERYFYFSLRLCSTLYSVKSMIDHNSGDHNRHTNNIVYVKHSFFHDLCPLGKHLESHNLCVANTLHISLQKGMVGFCKFRSQNCGLQCYNSEFRLRAHLDHHH